MAFILWMFVAAGAQAAATYDLKDESILGLYKIPQVLRSSEIKEAELIYNEDNVLVLRVDRNSQEYILEGPDTNGVVFTGDDEPNCDGGEEKCWYDSHTEIKLQKALVGGREIPQLTIVITESNAWDDSHTDDVTTTHILNWSGKLDHSIPFYVNTETQEPLAELAKSCGQELRNLRYEPGSRYLSVNDVCPYPHSVQLREPIDTALTYFLQSRGGATSRNRPQLVTTAALKRRVFNRARSIAKKYNPTRAEMPPREKIFEQIDKIEEYASKSDSIYTYRFASDAIVIVVDLKTKIVSWFSIKVAN